MAFPAVCADLKKLTLFWVGISQINARSLVAFPAVHADPKQLTLFWVGISQINAGSLVAMLDLRYQVLRVEDAGWGWMDVQSCGAGRTSWETPDGLQGCFLESVV